MRISPKKLLHGLLYTAPVFLLTLAACGGGGGGSTSTPSAGPFTLGGSITGLNGSGLVLQNNGGSDLTVASGVSSYTFASSVPKDSSYNVTVLTHPSSPTQICSVTGGSGTASADVTTANVSCVNAYTISGKIYGDPTLEASIGPILQNNGGDNLFIPTLPASGVAANFTFSIPIADGQTYAVTQLARAKSPGQNCAADANPASSVAMTGTVAGADVINVSIYCVSAPIVPKYAYVANNIADSVSAYKIDSATGALTATAPATKATGDGPYSVTVDPTGRFAYVANSNADTISAYSIDTVAGGDTGALTLLTDVNAGIAGNQTSIATGDYPFSITIHPSGEFAYTLNQGGGAGTGNTISAYSVNASSGALAAIDADGGTTGTQATIATGTTPYAITIDPLGKFAYVANYASNTISAYTIDSITGTLTSVGAAVAGTNPSSIAIDPSGKCALVTNNTSNNVMSYSIDTNTGVLTGVSTVASGTAPRSVAVDPNTGLYAYVANAGSANVSAFSVNPADCVIASIDTDAVTGGVNATITAGTTPISVNVDPSGLFVYVANLASNNVSVYKIGNGGALTPGTPVATATGTGPVSVTTTQ